MHNICVPDTHTAKHSTSSGLSHVRGHPDPHLRYTLSPGQTGSGLGLIEISGGRSSVSRGGGGGPTIGGGPTVGGGVRGWRGGGIRGWGGGRGTGGRGRTHIYMQMHAHLDMLLYIHASVLFIS